MAEKYRLQPILTVRKRVKRQAEIQLSIALKEFKEAKEKLKKLEEEKAEIVKAWKAKRREMEKEMGRGAFIGEGNRFVNFLRKLKEDQEKKEKEIEKQKAAIEKAKENVAKCRRKYIDACKSLQTMEKHKELWEKKQKDILTKKRGKGNG